MANEPMGPYSVKQADGEWVVRGPSFRGGHLICGDDEEAKEEAADWCFELNKAYAEGRASRDGLREALFEVTGWASDCYCLSEEEASSPGGKTCPGCVAKEALAEEEAR